MNESMACTQQVEVVVSLFQKDRTITSDIDNEDSEWKKCRIYN